MSLFRVSIFAITLCLAVLVPGKMAEANVVWDTVSRGVSRSADSLHLDSFDLSLDVDFSGVQNAASRIRHSVALSQASLASAVDGQVQASANVLSSISKTLYCSVTSFLRIGSCEETVATNPVGRTGDSRQSPRPEPTGGTATFIVGQPSNVRVQNNPQPRSSPTLIVQSSLPSYVAPVERSGLSENQVLALIERRIAAIEPVQINNTYQTISRGGDTVGFIQGPLGYSDLVDRVETLEQNPSSGASSQWTTNGSHIYYSTGNVGIGTTTPSQPLSVVGNVNFTGALQLSGDSGVAGRILQSNGLNAPSWVATSSLGITSSQWTSNSNDIHFATGNVAIGTTTTTGAALILNGHMRLTTVGATISGTTADSGDGIAVTLSGGTSSGGVQGGSIEATGGVTGIGGGVTLTGRNSGIGGPIQITAGNGTSNGGSNAIFSGGNGSNGGNISLSAGTGVGSSGGGVFINGGSGTVTGPVVLQNSSTGNVGIGTSSPTIARLTIVGASGQMPFLIASSSVAQTPMFGIATSGAILVNNNYGAPGTVLLSLGTGTAAQWVATSSLGIGGSQWTTSGNHIYYMPAGGTVSIGRSTPNGLFSIHDREDSTTLFTISTSTGAGTGTSTLFIVNANGQVGIGTTTMMTGDTLTVRGHIRLVDSNPSMDEVYIRAGTTTSGNGMNLRLQGGVVTANTNSEISLQGSSANSGGGININGGSGSVDNGGSININAGGGNSGNGGANVSFSGANSSGGGEINFNSGNTSSGGTRGAPIRLNGGSGPCCGQASRGFVLLQEFSGGQVGIGTSTPSSQFSIKGTGSINPLLISSSSDATYMSIIASGSVAIGTTTPSQLFHVWRGSNGIVARFEDSNGTCDIDPTGSGTGLTCSSDARLKRDIETLDSMAMLQKLSLVRPVTFKWNGQTDETLRFGVIAQELEQYFPEFVSTDPQSGYKSVSYGSFIPVLIASVQDLNTRLTKVEEALALAGTQSLNGPLHNLILDTITATLGVFNKVQIEDGVELKDKATGQTYCLTIVMGEWAKTQGACGTNINTNTGNNNNSGSGDNPSDDTNGTGTSTDPVDGDDTTDPDPGTGDQPADEPQEPTTPTDGDEPADDTETVDEPSDPQPVDPPAPSDIPEPEPQPQS